MIRVLLVILLLSAFSCTPAKAQMPGLYLELYLPYISSLESEHESQSQMPTLQW